MDSNNGGNFIKPKKIDRKEKYTPKNSDKSKTKSQNQSNDQGNHQKQQNSSCQKSLEKGEFNECKISDDIEENKDNLKIVFENCSDVVFREFTIGVKNRKALTLFTDGLVEKRVINDNVLEPLMHEARRKELDEGDFQGYLSLVEKSLITSGEVKHLTDLNEVIDGILSGSDIIFIDGFSTVISISVPGWKTRSVTEPTTEAVVRGPREGFVETIRINTALIRRRIKSPHLKMEMQTIGTYTKTNVIVTYDDSLVNKDVLKELKTRLDRIKIDAIMESTYIEELIEDRPFSVFPQIRHTERPDTAAHAILEGRIVILVDGSPFCLIVPTVFTDFIKVVEDFYERYYFGSFIRLLRYFFFFISLLAPALLIALTTYHQEMIPTQLLISIAQSRAGVPFPALIEVLAMEISFEALREAGIRLPRPVGQAVSIVGALVVGEAAVAAGLVSNVTVIVVAMTGISSFTIPGYSMGIAVRMLRFLFMFLAAGLGVVGIIAGLIAMMIHLVGIKSFGIPFMSPFAPLSPKDLLRDFIRAPRWALMLRPSYIMKHNEKRQKEGMKPRPPSD